MKPSLLFRIHMWFIRLLTIQVELIQSQLEINKLLRQIQDNANMMCVPRVFVDNKVDLCKICALPKEELHDCRGWKFGLNRNKKRRKK